MKKNSAEKGNRMLKCRPLMWLLLACALSPALRSTGEESPPAGAAGAHQHGTIFASGTQSTVDALCLLCAQAAQGANAKAEVCDDNCLIGNASTYAVVAPVGKQTVSMITQAPAWTRWMEKRSRWWAEASWRT